LKGSELGQFWKYRVGDYRIISSIEHTKLIITSYASATAVRFTEAPKPDSRSWRVVILNAIKDHWICRTPQRCTPLRNQLYKRHAPGLPEFTALTTLSWSPIAVSLVYMD